LEQDHGNDIAKFTQPYGNAFVLLAGSAKKVFVEIENLLVDVEGLFVLALLLEDLGFLLKGLDFLFKGRVHWEVLLLFFVNFITLFYSHSSFSC
jgi:hypothetical protein